MCFKWIVQILFSKDIIYVDFFKKERTSSNKINCKRHLQGFYLIKWAILGFKKGLQFWVGSRNELIWQCIHLQWSLLKLPGDSWKSPEAMPQLIERDKQLRVKNSFLIYNASKNKGNTERFFSYFYWLLKCKS